MKILIIIPAFNEAENISNSISDIRSMDFFSENFDILVINDGSTDTTGAKARSTGVKTIDLPYNMGIGNAVQTGYKFAKTYNYDYAFQFDADGQHPAEYIAPMLVKIQKEEASLIIGSRFINNEGFQSSLPRQIGIRFFGWLIKMLTGKTITDATAGFRIVDRQGISLLASYYPEDYAEPECIIYFNKCGLKVIEFPVIMKARQGGESSIGFLRSVYYMLKVPLAMIIGSLRNKSSYKYEE